MEITIILDVYVYTGVQSLSQPTCQTYTYGAAQLCRMHSGFNTALSKTSRSRINIQHPWLESTYTGLTLLCAEYDYRRYNQHMTIIIIYQSPGSQIITGFLL